MSKTLTEVCRCSEGLLDGQAGRHRIVRGHNCDQIRLVNSFLKEAEREATAYADTQFELTELDGPTVRRRREQAPYKAVWDRKFHELLDSYCIGAGIRKRGPRPEHQSRVNGVHKLEVATCAA
jgi:hypothetical protein